MPLSPLEHDRRYGELDQVIRAYAGQPADDTPDKPSEALVAYVRHTWHTRPWALAVAERQLREYADNPPGRLRLRLGEFYAGPGRRPSRSRPPRVAALPRRPHQAQRRGGRGPTPGRPHHPLGMARLLPGTRSVPRAAGSRRTCRTKFADRRRGDRRLPDPRPTRS
ncbi:hypothetical protein ACRAWF_29840 [Streptomyces sp. L7]